MLALNGIFVLVTQHGLEYPAFYARLYALLEPAAFQVGRGRRGVEGRRHEGMPVGSSTYLYMGCALRPPPTTRMLPRPHPKHMLAADPCSGRPPARPPATRRPSTARASSSWRTCSWPQAWCPLTPPHHSPSALHGAGRQGGQAGTHGPDCLGRAAASVPPPPRLRDCDRAEDCAGDPIWRTSPFNRWWPLLPPARPPARRLALSASPAGALVALAFVHNILRRHPACLQMLHRPPRAAAAPAGAVAEGEGAAASCGGAEAAGAASALPPVYSGQDVYDPAEPDPALSRAIESSLWELEALRAHANPTVGVRGAGGDGRRAGGCAGPGLRGGAVQHLHLPGAPPGAAAAAQTPDALAFSPTLVLFSSPNPPSSSHASPPPTPAPACPSAPAPAPARSRSPPSAPCWTRTWATGARPQRWTSPSCCPARTPRSSAPRRSAGSRRCPPPSTSARPPGSSTPTPPRTLAGGRDEPGST